MRVPMSRICSAITWFSQTAYKCVALVMLFIGGLAAYTFVWDLGDVGIGLMTIFNMVALLPLSGEAVAALKIMRNSVSNYSHTGWESGNRFPALFICRRQSASQ